MSSRNFRRRGHRRRHKPNGDAPVPGEQIQSFPECPICKKPVRDLQSALSHKETGNPAHFDCVLKELRDMNEVLPQEKICYLGGGTFGVLQFRASGSSKFTIKKKIPYEEKETPHEWKRALLISS